MNGYSIQYIVRLLLWSYAIYIVALYFNEIIDNVIWIKHPLSHISMKTDAWENTPVCDEIEFQILAFLLWML